MADTVPTAPIHRVGPKTDLLSQHATDQRAEGQDAPDDEAHRCVHPAQELGRAEPLAEAHLVHVVEDDCRSRRRTSRPRRARGAGRSC